MAAFIAVTAEKGSWNKDWMAHKPKIFTTTGPLRKICPLVLVDGALNECTSF